MATEKAIQEGIQTVVQRTGVFGSSGVLINDFDVLDQSVHGGPYFIIQNSDELVSEQETVTDTGSFTLPASIFVPFDSWKESLDTFRDARQSVIDEFNEVGTARSANGIDGVNIRVIRPDGPIDYLTADNNDPMALPVFITQRFIFEVQIYG